MGGIDLSLALRERATLEIIRLLRRFVVTRISHVDLHLHPPPLRGAEGTSALVLATQPRPSFADQSHWSFASKK